MEKLAPACLTPVFPGEMFGGRPPVGEQVETALRLLDRYGGLLGDHLILAHEEVAATERLRQGTGKMLVPLVGFRSRCGVSGCVDLARVRPPDGPYAEYLAYVLENLGRFEHVTVGNEFMEIGGFTAPGRNPFLDLRSTLDHLFADFRAVARRFPRLADRAVYGIADPNLQCEARAWAEGGEPTPLRDWLVARGRPCYSWVGFWPLYRSAAEIVAAYPDSTGAGHLGGTAHVQQWRGAFPFHYYSRYLKSGPRVISGIGLRSGARRHHLRRLVDFGYAGCLFLLPTDRPEDEWPAIMRDYLTDVDGGDRF